MIRLICLNDTKMVKLSQKQQRIILILLEKGILPSSQIRAEIAKTGENVSLVTVKRALSEMAKAGFLTVSGSGRSTSYILSAAGRIFAGINAKKYCAVEPDKRFGLNYYNFDLFSAWPAEIFSAEESEILNNATAEYQRRIKDLPPAIQKKELERRIIELSWKSSKIEGNTYTLLDTEK